ncbi:MAG: DUF2007 domain-containing protein [Bacillota bacterium]|jgi:hypothetical protein|nr:DUF2007 domain-containing protein [Bacillota bacterium]
MDENWVILTEVENDLEADIICGLLNENGIPGRKADSSPYTGAMRVIGGLAFEVQILVPEKFFNEAKEMLNNLNEE